MRRDRLEELQRLLDGHLEDLGDVLPLVVDLERLAVVALALADLARDVHVGQEVHLDLDDARALARLAAAALDVEAEAPRLVAAQPRLGHGGKQLAQRRPQPGVGCRVRARRAADRRLVDLDHLVDQVDPLDPVVLAGRLARAPDALGQRGVEDLRHQARLARAADAGDRHESAQRERDVDRLEVVLARARGRRSPRPCRCDAAPAPAPPCRRAGTPP